MRSHSALSSATIVLGLVLSTAIAPQTAQAQASGAPAPPAPPPAQAEPSPAPPAAQGEPSPAPLPAQAEPSARPQAAPRDGVTVHIESNDPGVALYQRTKVPGSDRITSEVICTSPCGVFIDRQMGDELFLGVSKVPLGERFSLPPGNGDVTLRADVSRRPSKGRKIAGAVLLPVGAAEILAGAVYATVDWPRQNGVDTNSLYHPMGIGLMVIGAAFSLTGIILLATASGDYKVVTPSQPETSAFRLRNVGFMPPFQTAEGVSPATATAVWEF